MGLNDPDVSNDPPDPGEPLRGGCQCGRVRFALLEPPTQATACHCRQCRQQSGHYLASANLPKAAVQLEGAEHLRWYASSPKVRRGFCGHCGSWLFWEPLFHDWTSVALGAIDGSTGLRLERHIFVAEKGDYYEIADGLPQNPR
ncbi:MAG: GFA family protein [Burkholderiales bacterium]|uniref:GFA family protein n=1 Tax=Inhella sp. TaxID=1921806 RepID=UPI001AC54072|nr:GFA family protein [Burkholderiales bacterium]